MFQASKPIFHFMTFIFFPYKERKTSTYQNSCKKNGKQDKKPRCQKRKKERFDYVKTFKLCYKVFHKRGKRYTKTSNRTKAMKGLTLTHWGISGKKRELCFFYLHISVSFKLLE